MNTHVRSSMSTSVYKPQNIPPFIMPNYARDNGPITIKDFQIFETLMHQDI